MSYFKKIFNESLIYDLFFFNVKTVRKCNTVLTLNELNPTEYYICSSLYDAKYGKSDMDKYGHTLNDYYVDTFSVNHPEFSQLMSISYGWLVPTTDGKVERQLKSLSVDNFESEHHMLVEFFKIVNGFVGNKKTTTLCGFGMREQTIPFIYKKYLINRNLEVFDNVLVPEIFEISLDNKPWENFIIDCYDVWRFNASTRHSSIGLICKSMGVYGNEMLYDSRKELSDIYWNMVVVDENKEGALNFIKRQSMLETNMTIRFMYELNKSKRK